MVCAYVILCELSEVGSRFPQRSVASGISVADPGGRGSGGQLTPPPLLSAITSFYLLMREECRTMQMPSGCFEQLLIQEMINVDVA